MRIWQTPFDRYFHPLRVPRPDEWKDNLGGKNLRLIAPSLNPYHPQAVHLLMPFFSPKGGEGAKGSAKGRTSDALRHCQHFPIPTPPWVEEKFCPPTRQAKGQKWICTLFPSRRQLFVLHSPTVAHTDVPPAVMALGHTILLSVAVAKCHSDTGQPEVATPFTLNPLTPLFVVSRIATFPPRDAQ